MEAFNALFQKFTAEQVVTLMSNSVAARLEDPNWMEAFNALFQKLTAEQVVTLMSGSVAARLEDPNWMEAFNALFQEFTAEQVVTLMSDSVAARLKRSSWMGAFNALFDRLTTEQIVSMIGACGGGIAARLEDPDFYQDLVEGFPYTTKQLRELISSYPLRRGTVPGGSPIGRRPR